MQKIANREVIRVDTEKKTEKIQRINTKETQPNKLQISYREDI